MVTEAQKRANERYKSKMRAEGAMGSITATFYGKDMALLEYARAHGPAATFVKQLIRERMEAVEDGYKRGYVYKCPVCHLWHVSSMRHEKDETGRSCDGRQR